MDALIAQYGGYDDGTPTGVPSISGTPDISSTPSISGLPSLGLDAPTVGGLVGTAASLGLGVPGLGLVGAGLGGLADVMSINSTLSQMNEAPISSPMSAIANAVTMGLMGTPAVVQALNSIETNPVTVQQAINESTVPLSAFGPVDNGLSDAAAVADAAANAPEGGGMGAPEAGVGVSSAEAAAGAASAAAAASGGDGWRTGGLVRYARGGIVLPILARYGAL